MKASSVNIKENLKNLRFDASYHLSEGLQVKRIISLSPYKILRVCDVTKKIFYGNRAKRVYVNSRKNGEPFLSSSDILQADLENVKLASKKYTPNKEQLRLEKGWTLISRSGTIGNCAFSSQLHAQKLASEDVIRLVPNYILREGVIYAYLASKYGHSLLTQGTFGAVIQHIEPDFVGSIPIPNFPEDFQKEVDDLIQESAKLREEAARELKEAQLIIETKFQTQKVQCSNTVKFKDIKKDPANRFDASYHLSEGIMYENIIKKGKYAELGSLCKKIYGGGRAKRYYTDDHSKGLPYLSNSDLGKANSLRSCKYTLRSKGFDESSILKSGMIVTGRVGAIGQTQYIGDNFEKMEVLGSDNVIRIVPISHNGYLYAYLSSKIGNCMFWKYATGGVQPFISSDMVGRILVPLLCEEDVDKCDEKIKIYSINIELAAIKENKAISMVEQKIEKWNNKTN